ncbi:hypothetical protein EXU48_08590 [Occultella glacieicola]|uniref:DUF4351 domain-containing protein n=1 Tax=Occultella glacieicola TaxID=2518684 RepID=A0ABY2E4A0_9MICO|nr:hypothetical protein [Occultella glacieicola]TDE94841.1 hypothetical protein EXU48_08590 [Occultella glacieicola]
MHTRIARRRGDLLGGELSPAAARAERDAVLGRIARTGDEDDLRMRASTAGLDAREMSLLDDLDALEDLIGA